MADVTLQTDARLGRALVALQEWKSLTTEEWGAAAGFASHEAPLAVRHLAEGLHRRGLSDNRTIGQIRGVSQGASVRQGPGRQSWS